MIQETNSLFLYHSCGPSLPLAEINNHGRFKLFSCTVFTTDNTVAICTLKKVTIRQKRWKREEADKKKLTCKKIMQTRKREENKKKKKN